MLYPFHSTRFSFRFLQFTPPTVVWIDYYATLPASRNQSGEWQRRIYFGQNLGVFWTPSEYRPHNEIELKGIQDSRGGRYFATAMSLCTFIPQFTNIWLINHFNWNMSPRYCVVKLVRKVVQRLRKLKVFNGHSNKYDLVNWSRKLCL